MNLKIRAAEDGDLEALVELSLLAWAPVFVSFEELLGPEIFPIIYPDWKKSQAGVVRDVCGPGDKYTVWVADVDGIAVGFVAYALDPKTRRGEVGLLAVHPDHQNAGIGTELNEHALEKMREAGMEMAELCAGGDASHAPARRSYEKAGYTPLPLTRYYRRLK